MTAITPEPAVAAAVAADAWLRRFREILIGVLGGTVAAIGALAFYTSFEAIKQYANGSGGIAPEHDWAIPLLVDSFIVVATGADVWFATTGHRRRLWEIWWPKALLAGAAGVSFALNVAHATLDKWTARGVAAIPPAALVLGVELLMMVLRRATALRTERLAAAQAEAEAAALAVTLERSTPTGRNRPELPARTRNRAAGSARNHRGGAVVAACPGGRVGAGRACRRPHPQRHRRGPPVRHLHRDGPPRHPRRQASCRARPPAAGHRGAAAGGRPVNPQHRGRVRAGAGAAGRPGR